MNIHIENSPLKGFLTEDEKEKININLSNWKKN